MKTKEINDALLDRLLQLGRLSLEDADERRAMKASLNTMAAWLQKLREVDVEGVAPMTTMTTATNRLREDVPEAPLDVEQVLCNAPDRSSHYFRTPSVQKP